jgi:hypothetical protein
MGDKADVDIDRGELIASRDRASLEPVTRFDEKIEGIIQAREVDRNELVDLGFTPSEAQTFVEKFKELKIKKRGGEKAPELEKDLMDIARTVVARKLEVIRGTGLNTGLSDKGSEAQVKKDDLQEVLDAQMKSLPAEYREMVEEYFKSIAEEKK